MSRRERDNRDSDSKRRRSGFDRKPSPKRYRRDGKPETERVPSNTNMNVEGQTGQYEKRRHHLQDALPLKASSAADSKLESGAASKESDKKPNGFREGSKHFSDPTEVTQSRSYFQHDERGNAGQVGRSFGRRATTEHRLRDSKHDRNDKAKDKSSTYGSQGRDEKSQAKENDNIWRHDGFFKMEAEPAAPMRKRPAFREKKIQVESENDAKADTEPVRAGHSACPTSVSERRERDLNPRHSDRLERPVIGDKKEAYGSGLLSRERHNGGGGGGYYRGRDRYNGRQGYQPNGTRGEKWKHDLFDDANRSPTTINEEDQIAKVEEILAS